MNAVLTYKTAGWVRFIQLNMHIYSLFLFKLSLVLNK
jgi:hypothetical protein